MFAALADMLFVGLSVYTGNNSFAAVGCAAGVLVTLTLITVSIVYSKNSMRHLSKMNAHLETSAAQYMNSLPTPIAVIDDNRQIVWYNQFFAEKISLGSDVYGLDFEGLVNLDLDALIADGSAYCPINGSIYKASMEKFDEKDNITFQYIGLQGATVKGPKPQLTRVFVNLLTNAVQAIENQQKEDAESGRKPKQGRIHLSLRNSTREGFYDIVFEDNGPGVGDENRARLFTPNFTTKSSGTGLGLAICKNILERCGGDISYSRSFTLGGACFTVRFPKLES